MLNSIEFKDFRFISGEQFHLMVLVFFLFRIQFKEKPLRVYMCQWDISIILPRRSVFFRFSLLSISEGEICDVRSTKRFDRKMSVQVPITFSNLRLAISCL